MTTENSKKKKKIKRSKLKEHWHQNYQNGSESRKTMIAQREEKRGTLMKSNIVR